MNNRRINMPKELVYRVAKEASKSGNRSLMDGLCLFIGLKLMYGSSAMNNVTIKKVSNTFGIGFQKAKKSLEFAKSMNSWFRWDSDNNTLTARRVFDNPDVVKKNNKTGRRSVFCITFTFDSLTDITFRSIQRQIRQGLALCPINNIQRRDNSAPEGTSASRGNCNPRARRSRSCLSYDMLANSMCVSKSTAYREIKSMEAAGTISITTHPIIPVVDAIDGEFLVDDANILNHRRGFYVGTVLCIRDCNDYHINNIKQFRTVRNVILGYHSDKMAKSRTNDCMLVDECSPNYDFFDNPKNACFL